MMDGEGLNTTGFVQVLRQQPGLSSAHMLMARREGEQGETNGLQVQSPIPDSSTAVMGTPAWLGAAGASREEIKGAAPRAGLCWGAEMEQCVRVLPEK